MDALIMAAGRGSRLGGESDSRPKGLVDIGGISPLELQIDILISRSVERATVVTGYRRAMVEDAVTRRARGRIHLDFAWNPFWPVTNVLGSVWMARESLIDDFVYLHADTVFTPSILDDCLASIGPAALPIDFRACEPEQMKASVVDGRVTYLSKELDAEASAGEFIGIGVFRSASLAPLRLGIDDELEAGGTSSYFEAAINRAVVDSGLEVVAVPTKERPWTEIDFREDLELARQILPSLRP